MGKLINGIAEVNQQRMLIKKDFSKERLERVEGIEPSTKAWEAFVLPLNYTRSERLTLYQMPGAS